MTAPTPYLTALDAGLLFADPTYQRDVDEARVQRMVEEYDPRQLGVLEVSKREDGRYAVLDGHHRLTAAVRRRGASGWFLPCNVHEGLTLGDEASLFFELDRGRRGLNPWEKWRARRGAGDPDVLQIEKVLRAHQLEVTSAPRDGAIGAIGVLEKLVALGGTDLLDDTLSVVIAAYGRVRDGLDGVIVHGVGLVLDEYSDELDLERLVTSLQDQPPRTLKSRARALREAHNTRIVRLIAETIVTRYNVAPGPKLQPYLLRTDRPRRKAQAASPRPAPSDPRPAPRSTPPPMTAKPVPDHGRVDLADVAFEMAAGHAPAAIAQRMGVTLSRIAEAANRQDRRSTMAVRFTRAAQLEANRAGGR